MTHKLVIAALLLAGACISVGCQFFEKWRDDCVAEELLEGLIHKELGVDIDLTPDSPEKP